MARPLRIDVAGAWYHVMNRGHRGGALFLEDADRHRFLGTVVELPERFALELHAFVLMNNHYHLLVRTGEDPLGETGGINLYGFVGSNPVSGIDPFGLQGTFDFNCNAGPTGPGGPSLTPSFGRPNPAIPPPAPPLDLADFRPIPVFQLQDATPLQVWLAFTPIKVPLGWLSKVPGISRFCGAAAKEASLLPVRYDAEFAASQFLGTRPFTSGGRQIMPHAAERMVSPPPGRAPMNMFEVDQVLNAGNKIRKVDFLHPKGPTVTIQNTMMPGKPQVVVDAATGQRVVTVIQPKP